MNFKVYRTHNRVEVIENASTKIEFTRTHIMFFGQWDGYPLTVFRAEDVFRVEREKDGS